MLVVFIFGCLIPATIRVIQQFKYQLIAAVLAIFCLRMALGAYVATMTKGLQANSEALLEWCRHRWVCLKIGYPENNTGLSPLFLWNYNAVAIPFLDTAIWKNVYILFLFLEGHKSHFQTLNWRSGQRPNRLRGWLEWLHQAVQPQKHAETAAKDGDSLKLKSRRKAISVEHRWYPSCLRCLLFPLTMGSIEYP